MNLNNSFKHISSLGSLEIYIVIIISFFLSTFFEFALFLAVGLSIMYFLAIPLRLICFKNRPITEEYSTFLEKIKASSFPSMHAGRSTFLVASLIGFLKYDFGYLMIVFLVSVWFSVLYSRIYLKRHDIEDIFGGVCLGIIVFYLFLVVF